MLLAHGVGVAVAELEAVLFVADDCHILSSAGRKTALAVRFEGNGAPAMDDDAQRTPFTPIAQTIAGTRQQSRTADLQSQGSDRTSETSRSRAG